jgi:hypothetical protein
MREHPPSMLRNIDGGPPLRGARAVDPGAPTINAKKHQWWSPGPRGGSGPHSGFERCVVTCIGVIEKMLLMGPILPALSSVMTDDP